MSSTGGTSNAPHRWRFFRSGGFDQVRLDTGADLLHLSELDQKLWAVLSCPASGLEFDPRTLALLDTAGDGRIRVPEILAAVAWICSVLKDPGSLCRCSGTLPLAAIDAGKPEGRRLLASAQRILANLGKADAAEISIEDTADTARIFVATRFNGDGIVPAEAAGEDAVKAVIQDIMACLGNETDRSGKPGVSQAIADAFFDEAGAYLAWWDRGASGFGDILPMGEDTEAAAAVFDSVRAKVEDYFTRCQLAAFDPQAAAPLNPGVATYAALGEDTLSVASEALAALPLARIAGNAPLPLTEGLNPAWAVRINRFQDRIVTPVLGERAEITRAEWIRLDGMFTAYREWQGQKAGSAVEKLGPPRIREILNGDARAAIGQLIEQDRAVAAEADAIEAVDRLVRYHRDLYTLLNNYVSLRDFYSAKTKAVFQAGTLYLDGRSCELCLRVNDLAKHSALANLSGTYLAYCECVRKGDGETMTIAAALTGGDSDNLMVGRNGVFYDRQGRDWDATVVKIVDHPISVQQAFWSPYKRIARMVSRQIEKFAASRDKAVEDQAAARIAETTEKTRAGQPAAPAAPFDIAKFAGIFAAIGLAIGAIGTALAAVLTGFLSLPGWQIPLALAGIVLAISGPSMLLAYLKLRQRNLAPLLDANGWAINTRARINIPFGSALTAVAALPPGAERSLNDPYSEKKRPWKTYLVLLFLLSALAYLGQEGYPRQWWTQFRAAVEESAETPAPTPGAATPPGEPAAGDGKE